MATRRAKGAGVVVVIVRGVPTCPRGVLRACVYVDVVVGPDGAVTGLDGGEVVGLAESTAGRLRGLARGARRRGRGDVAWTRRGVARVAGAGRPAEGGGKRAGGGKGKRGGGVYERHD